MISDQIRFFEELTIKQGSKWAFIHYKLLLF
jgi:hypothetical protein